MDIFQSLFLGIIQGLTEWLPISSSGHLALFQILLNIKVPLLYDLLLHVGTLIGVVGVYKKDIVDLIKSVFVKDHGDDKNISNRKMLFMIIVATVPTGTIGVLFQILFRESFYNLLYVSIGFLITSVFLFITKFSNSSAKGIGIHDALLIGVAQGFSIFSSISRSGITISVGLLRGINKEELIKFSFLLSIPAILGGLVFDLFTMDKNDLTENISISFESYLIGIASAAIVGYLSIKLLITIISKNKMFIFSYYCFFLGIFVLLLSI